MNKKKFNIFFNELWTYPAIGLFTGFGIFWFYRILKINVWVSLLVGLYVAAVISRCCNVKKIKIMGEKHEKKRKKR
ncbi:hypothetical protein KY333_03710 [Candidatus Woesearchaeota archaeon]|nr:hypothetical protein [Candidatus Woesearchaeota archaeon]